MTSPGTLLGCKGGLAFCGGERTAWINNSSMNSQALLKNKEAVRHHGTFLAWESWSSMVREHDPNPSWSTYFSVIMLTLFTHLSLVLTFSFIPFLSLFPSHLSLTKTEITRPLLKGLLKQLSTRWMVALISIELDSSLEVYFSCWHTFFCKAK